MQETYAKLLDYSLYLLGLKQYSEKQLAKKIEQRGEKLKLTNIADAKVKVVERLKELGYLNDSKIAADYIAYTLPSKPEGKRAFYFRMLKKGINKTIIMRAWENKTMTEEELALDVARKALQKFNKLAPNTRKRRLANLLARRGFSSSVAWGILSKINEKRA